MKTQSSIFRLEILRNCFNNSATILLCTALLCTSALADRWGPSGKDKTQGLIDGQAYSKEESTRRLDPQVKQLLDALLRMRSEPGLFSARDAIYKALGVTKIERTSRDLKNTSASYFDVFAPTGIFARPGWKAWYRYDGRENVKDLGMTWFAAVIIETNWKSECIETRAVEGYLDLPLIPDFRKTTAPGRRTAYKDRHTGLYSVTIASSTDQVPDIYIDYIRGCVSRIDITNTFKIQETSDAKAQYQ